MSIDVVYDEDSVAVTFEERDVAIPGFTSILLFSSVIIAVAVYQKKL